jgi:hypothetical protein
MPSQCSVRLSLIIGELKERITQTLQLPAVILRPHTSKQENRDGPFPCWSVYLPTDGGFSAMITLTPWLLTETLPQPVVHAPLYLELGANLSRN